MADVNTLQEYRQALQMKYAALDSPEDRAKFLYETAALYECYLGDSRYDNMQIKQAIDDFVIGALTPVKEDGSFDFDAAEDLCGRIAKLRSDSLVEAGATIRAAGAGLSEQRAIFQAQAVKGFFESHDFAAASWAYRDRMADYVRADCQRKNLASLPAAHAMGGAFAGLHHEVMDRSAQEQRLAIYRDDEREKDLQAAETAAIDVNAMRNDHLSSSEVGRDLALRGQLFLQDFDAIYDMKAMKSFLDEVVTKMDVVTQDPALASMVGELAAQAGSIQGASEKGLVVPADFREKSRQVLLDVAEKMQGPSQDAHEKAYSALRGAKYVKGLISGQEGYDRQNIATDTASVRKVDELYHKMCEKDRSGSLHRDSAEYKAMFSAVEAIHKAAAGYDPEDAVARAGMRELMDKAEQAAKAYAEKNVYGKDKSRGYGQERQNSSLLLLDVASGGKGIDWQRVTSLSAVAPASLSGQIHQAYGDMAGNERRKGAVAAEGEHLELQDRIRTEHKAAKKKAARKPTSLQALQGPAAATPKSRNRPMRNDPFALTRPDPRQMGR